MFLEHVLPTEEQYKWLEFLSIRTRREPTVLLSKIENVEDLSVLLDSVHIDEEGVVSVLAHAEESGRHVISMLSDEGCVPFRIKGTTDRLYVGGIVENWNVLKSIGEQLETNQREFDLLSVEETSVLHRPFDERRLRHVVQDSLTTSQFELLATAFQAGYFSVPRDTTSKELAEQLDVGQSTLSERLRTAQAELYRLILETS